MEYSQVQTWILHCLLHCTWILIYPLRVFSISDMLIIWSTEFFRCACYSILKLLRASTWYSISGVSLVSGHKLAYIGCDLLCWVGLGYWELTYSRGMWTFIEIDLPSYFNLLSNWIIKSLGLLSLALDMPPYSILVLRHPYNIYLRQDCGYGSWNLLSST